jgi:MFS family permease
VDGWHSNSIATVTDPGTASLRTDLRALPRPVWFLLAGSFVNRFGSFVLPFLVLYLTHHRGYTAAQAGLALSAYGVGSASAAAAGGVRADHVGRRATIALSMYSSAIVMLALSRAGSLAAVVPLTALAGLAAESYRPASSALLADLVPQGRRVTAFAAYRLARSRCSCSPPGPRPTTRRRPAPPAPCARSSPTGRSWPCSRPA